MDEEDLFAVFEDSAPAKKPFSRQNQEVESSAIE
jgi:hypothetical protein